MKKALVALLVVVLLAGMVGCGGSTSGSSQSQAASASSGANASSGTAAPSEVGGEETGGGYSDAQVAVLLPGVITDNGWNAQAYNGLMYLGETYGCVTEYIENVAVSDIENYLRGYGDRGFDLIISHGAQYLDLVNAVAPDFPDSYFQVSVPHSNAAESENVILAGSSGSGLLAGVVAGALSENGNVAFLGGEPNASISPLVNEFDDGVALTNPDATAYTAYMGTLTDQGMAKEQALAMIQQYDIDVICGSANSAGLGVLQAAEEMGILAVGFNSDQYSVAPEHVVVSVLSDFSVIFDFTFTKVMEGTIEPFTPYPLSTKDGAVRLSDWHGWDQKIDPERVQAILDTIQAFMDGTIDEIAIIEANKEI